MAAIEIPTEPIERDPPTLLLSHDDRRALLRDALAGVELGAYDRHVIAWLSSLLDTPTLLTLTSLVYRARAIGATGRLSSPTR
jgi:hypothetical protein